MTRPLEILVADDENTARLLMQAALEKSGFKVILAVSGADALRQFRAHPCDMVMLDVMMPDLDGYQVCAALRAEVGDELPIVMVTVLDDIDAIERAYDSGATDFISKPINWPLIGHRVKYFFRAYRALLELRDANERNAAMLNAIPDLMFELDLDGRFLNYHASRDELLFLPSEVFLGRTVVEILPADASAVCMSALWEAQEKGFSIGKQYELQIGAGKHWFELSVARMRDSAGGKPQFIVLLRDITERKRVEDDLRASEERWKFALEGAGDGVWDRNIETGEVLFSSRYKEVLGFTDEEFPNRREEWEKRIHPEDKPRVMRDLQSYLNGDSAAYASEFRMRCKDGGWKWILSRGMVVSRDAQGAPLRMIGTHADTTVRKEIERRKDEFITVINHELRTPLTAIVGSLGLLSESSDPGMTQTLIHVARSNAQRLVRLINEILDADKLSSEATKFSLEPVELEGLLAAAIQVNRGYGEQYGVSMALTESHGPAWVNANADKLMQVMDNLLSNAVKFSPRGARVEVRLTRIGDIFRVSVIDFGPGVPENFKPHIFDRFAQADTSNSRDKDGTGLGLAICKMIVDKLGGKIGFVNVPGGGATFYFELDARAHLPAMT